MFNHRYFGQAYYGEAYFGDGIGAIAEMTVFAVDTDGSYVPIYSSEGSYAYSPTTTGSYVTVITSGGEP